MDEAERKEWTRRVLAFLNHEKRRCTYGALADTLGVLPQAVGQYLGEIRQEASWVVRKETGMPTGYPPDKLAKEFPKDPKDRPAPIDCPEELRRLVSGFDGGGIDPFEGKVTSGKEKKAGCKSGMALT